MEARLGNKFFILKRLSVNPLKTLMIFFSQNRFKDRDKKVGLNFALII